MGGTLSPPALASKAESVVSVTSQCSFSSTIVHVGDKKPPESGMARAGRKGSARSPWSPSQSSRLPALSTPSALRRGRRPPSQHPTSLCCFVCPPPASSVLPSVHKVWGGGHPQGADQTVRRQGLEKP